MTGLDLAVLLLYLIGINVWGAWLGRGQTGGTDYFLGNRDLPWGAVLVSVVGAETSIRSLKAAADRLTGGLKPA